MSATLIAAPTAADPRGVTRGGSPVCAILFYGVSLTWYCLLDLQGHGATLRTSASMWPRQQPRNNDDIGRIMSKKNPKRVYIGPKVGFWTSSGIKFPSVHTCKTAVFHVKVARIQEDPHRVEPLNCTQAIPRQSLVRGASGERCAKRLLCRLRAPGNIDPNVSCVKRMVLTRFGSIR